MRTQRRPVRTSLFRYAPLVAALASAFAPAAAQAAACVPYQVSSNGDNSGVNPAPGACTGTLRQAIIDANADCDASLNFAPAIRFTGPFVIQAAAALPPLQCTTPGTPYTPSIDATTVAGYAANTDPNAFNGNFVVALDGSAMAAYGGVDGLNFSTFYGGVLSVTGIELENLNTALQGNVNARGNFIHNNGVGLLVNGSTGSGASVGGSALGDRNYFLSNSTGANFGSTSNIVVDNNVFAGNTSYGILASSVDNLSVIDGNRFVANSYGLVASAVTNSTVTDNFFGTLDGVTQNGNTSYGIDWDESTGTISRNVIVGNASAGVHLLGDGGTAVSFNKIGVNTSVDAALGNGWGVTLDFSYGADVHDNTISGNLYGGVLATLDNGSQIRNNKIGLNGAGNAALANGSSGGVELDNSSLTQIVNNYISGNNGPGVDLFNSSNILIKDNFIGVSVSAALAIGNTDGISTQCGNNITIQDNLIGGNSGNGITLMGTNGPGAPPPPALANTDPGLKRAKVLAAPNILFNRIGIVSGTNSKPNGGFGIWIGSSACAIGDDGSGNSLFQNTIANNNIGVELAGGTGITLSQNTVYNNTTKNVDINNNYGGPLPNDDSCVTGGPDCDTGPNNQQNYPEITGVAQAAGNTTIGFQLYSTPSTVFNVEIFDNPAMPSLPAGRTYRANTFLTTDANGFAVGSFTLGALTNFITLTATDQTSGDSSEYSPVGTFVPAPAVSLSATTLDFGTLNVGQTSASQTVTLTSTGSAPYHINAFDSVATCYGGPVCVGGDFTCSLGCSTSTSYAAGQTCTISAAYHPSAPGSTSTNIFICDNVGIHSIELIGNAVAATSSLSMTPPSVDFGSVLVGQQSNGQQFVVTNTGAGAASLGSWVLNGDFGLSSTTCGPTLAPSASCTATVAFVPSLPGLRTGTIAMNPPIAVARDGAKVTTTTPLVSASLKGTGTQVAQLDLPTSIDFGSFTVGSSLASLSVGLRNTGNAVVTFSSVSIGAPFTLVNNCPLNLAPGQSCTLTLGFNPTTLGDFSGTLTIVSNAQGGSRNIPVTAHVVAQPVPLIHVTPGFIGFGDRMIGTQTATQRITIRNDGGAPAPVDLTTLSNDFLIVGNTCGTSIAAQGSCFADIAFQPAGFGGRAGQFRVNSVSVGDDQVTNLSGTGCRPFVPGTSRNHQQSGGCSP